MTDILIPVVVVVVAILALGLILARLYRRASKELSFVRTGMGGQKVIINGGALVLPILHEVIPVNMNTLRLEVRRANEQALITHDRMRVDVTAEFYVRAKPTADSIANAAQTLGLKTTRPDELKVLVEGKFVDALRAVAAEMAMEELHEKRVDFVQKVQQVVSEDLLKNGLELESVSLTGLDQTSVQHFNPRNAFDAEGLTRLTQAIESRRKTRNDIEQDTEVEVRTKNLDAERLKLDIARDQEYAQLSQAREVAVRKADQAAEIAIEEASKNRDAQEAEIQAKRQVEIANIDAERTVEEQRITMQQAVNNREIERDRLVETARIEQKKTIELADQDRTIAVAERSKAQSEAERAANQARSAAVREEERVATARDVEVAERTKQVELVDARKAAERDAIAIEVKAEAEKRAATDQSEAVRTIAQADADKQRIAAQGLAEAEDPAGERGGAPLRGGRRRQATGPRGRQPAVRRADLHEGTPGAGGAHARHHPRERQADGTDRRHQDLPGRRPGRKRRRQRQRRPVSRRRQPGRSDRQQRAALPGTGAPARHAARRARPGPVDRRRPHAVTRRHLGRRRQGCLGRGWDRTRTRRTQRSAADRSAHLPLRDGTRAFPLP